MTLFLALFRDTPPNLAGLGRPFASFMCDWWIEMRGFHEEGSGMRDWASREERYWRYALCAV
jgi:hypothetical protein